MNVIYCTYSCEDTGYVCTYLGYTVCTYIHMNVPVSFLLVCLLPILYQSTCILNEEQCCLDILNLFGHCTIHLRFYLEDVDILNPRLLEPASLSDLSRNVK